MNKRLSRGLAPLLALPVAFSLAGAVLAQGGDDLAPPEPPAAPAPPAPPEPTPPEPALPQPQAAPTYWIGVIGGEVSDELRSHLGLEGAGVLVRDVAPGSPADEAGLKKHDVLLTANGRAVTDMASLADVVRQVSGQENGEIALELLRTGGHQQVSITPTVRPDAPAPDAPPAGGAGAVEGLRRIFGEDVGRERPFQFRMFGPGVAVGGANVDIRAPGNTSVQVQTNNGQTHVRVTQGENTWVVDSADPKSLEQLPPDVRPMVEGLMNVYGVNVAVDVQDFMPQLEGILQGLGERWSARRDDRVRDRIDALERQLEALRGRLGAEGDAAPAPAPPGADELAPPFDPAQPVAPPVELELPAPAQ